MSTLTDERISKIIESMTYWAHREAWLNDLIVGQKVEPVYIDCVAALQELQTYRQAACDSFEINKAGQVFIRDALIQDGSITNAEIGKTHRDMIRRQHAEWSDVTFGSVGPVGPLKHLSKEALEAAAEPGDLSEWADMQFLYWDAQRRAGISDEQITTAMIEKLKVNKARQWPEPKDGEPRLHIKAAPQQEAK
jgi:hypothetical protein